MLKTAPGSSLGRISINHNVDREWLAVGADLIFLAHFAWHLPSLMGPRSVQVYDPHKSKKAPCGAFTSKTGPQITSGATFPKFTMFIREIVGCGGRI